MVSLTVVSGLLPAAQVYVGKIFLDALITIFNSRQVGAALSSLTTVFCLQFGITLLRTVMNHVEGYVTFSMGRTLSFCMGKDVIERVMNLAFPVFDEPGFHDVMSRAQQECSGRPMMLLHQVTGAAREIITFLSMCGIMLVFGWALFVASLLTCLPLLLVQVKFGQLGYQMQYDRAEEQRRADYYSGLLMSKAARAEVSSYGMHQFLFSQWLTAAKKFMGQDFGLQRKQTFSQMGINVGLAACSMGVTIYIIYVGLFRRDDMSVGSIMMYCGSFAAGLASPRISERGLLFEGYRQDWVENWPTRGWLVCLLQSDPTTPGL